MKLHQSSEDYLEAILILHEKSGHIRSVDIANQLSVSKPSVSSAIKKLIANKLIRINDFGFIELTHEGMKIAKGIYERHILLSNFLVELGVDCTTAYSDACRIEHYMSDASFTALKNYMQSGRLGRGDNTVTMKAFMSMVSQAMHKLRSLGALTVDMLEAFRRENVSELNYCANDAILISHSCGIHMLWCSKKEAGLTALSTLSDIDCCVCHGKAAHDAMIEFRPDFTVDGECLQYCLSSRKPAELKNNCAIRPLMITEAEFVIEHYALEDDIEHVRNLIKEGKMFGAIIDGKLAAFIGLHSDGSSGMLEVLPEYRRRGIGTELESFFQNYQLEKGWMPYGHVYVTNTASLKMQAKMNLAVSNESIWWIFK